MIRVYVVEDNPHLLEDSVLCLGRHGFDCHGAPDAAGFDALMSGQWPDVVVLDWMLPGEDGLAIARRLRADARTARLGLIFLTARSTLDDRVAGLEAADSYLVKPVDYRELAAVIVSVYRRLGFGDLPKDQSSWRLLIDKLELHSPTGEIISLSHRECVVLRELARNASMPVSAKTIALALDEDWLSFEKNRLELLLSRLRSKIRVGDDANANPFRSARNQGYRLMVPMIVSE